MAENRAFSNIVLESCIFKNDESFDGDLFEDETVAEKYFCVICQGVAKNPLETSCGHIFCNICYTSYEQESNNDTTCPTCRSTIEFKYISKRLTREINNLKVICANIFDSQCEWKGLLSNAKNHIKNDCKYIPIICQFCKDETNPYQRINEKKHYKICGEFPKICQYCNLAIKTKDFDKHTTKECSNIKIKCPNNCNKIIKNCELNIHLKKYCLNRNLKCKYYIYGCNTNNIKMNALKEHMKHNNIKHLELKMLYLERLSKSTELIYVPNTKNKSYTIGGLYKRQNKPYFGKPWYKHVNNDKKYIIQWNNKELSWMLYNTFDNKNKIIAYKRGNYATPLCTEIEYNMYADGTNSDVDNEHVDVDDGIVYFDEKKDDNNNDINNIHNKPNCRWFFSNNVDGEITKLKMDGYSKKEYDLWWELCLLKGGQKPNYPSNNTIIAQITKKYAATCICGNGLTETKNKDPNKKVKCDNCEHDIFNGVLYYTCTIGNGSISHLQGYDLCQICTKVRCDVQNLQFKSKCICKHEMKPFNAGFVYPHSRTIICNNCRQKFTGPDTIYHCTKESKKHSNGCDYCIPCAKKLSTPKIGDIRNWKLW